MRAMIATNFVRKLSNTKVNFTFSSFKQRNAKNQKMEIKSEIERVVIVHPRPFSFPLPLNCSSLRRLPARPGRTDSTLGSARSGSVDFPAANLKCCILGCNDTPWRVGNDDAKLN